jgi:hypothetical protein
MAVQTVEAVEKVEGGGSAASAGVPGSAMAIFGLQHLHQLLVRELHPATYDTNRSAL